MFLESRTRGNSIIIIKEIIKKMKKEKNKD